MSKPTVYTELKVKKNMEVVGTITNAALTAKLAEIDTELAAGLKFVKLGTITFANTTAKTLASVPKGCLITQMVCVVKTAFNSGDSDTLAIGVSGDADAFMATTDITATVLGGYTKALGYETGAAAVPVVATWTGAGTAATAGSADVYAVYFEE